MQQIADESIDILESLGLLDVTRGGVRPRPAIGRYRLEVARLSPHEVIRNPIAHSGPDQFAQAAERIIRRRVAGAVTYSVAAAAIGLDESVSVRG